MITDWAEYVATRRVLREEAREQGMTLEELFRWNSALRPMGKECGLLKERGDESKEGMKEAGILGQERRKKNKKKIESAMQKAALIFSFLSEAFRSFVLGLLLAFLLEHFS